MKFAAFALVAGLWIPVLAGCARYEPNSLSTANPGAVKPAERVVVYYMHRTLRCISCLSIENQTRQALNDAFAAELAAGKVEFHCEDYWMNTDLARRYDVDTVSVVIVVVAGGREVSHENLQRVWELKGSSEELRTYIAQAVRGALAKAAG